MQWSKQSGRTGKRTAAIQSRAPLVEFPEPQLVVLELSVMSQTPLTADRQWGLCVHVYKTDFEIEKDETKESENLLILWKEKTT